LARRRRATFPLVPRRRFAGTEAGGRRSIRRGEGDEVAGSRAYRPGDHVSAINWAASARLSAARGTDEFVVDEHFAEQMPRVALAVDRRPAMGMYEPPLPWLDKAAATRAVVELVAASAAAARAPLAAVTRKGVDGRRAVFHPESAAAEDELRAGLVALLRRRDRLPLGSFLFVVSDFLFPLEHSLWVSLVRAGWDVTPVVVQDPTWEQSFPVGVAGVSVAFAGASGGRVREAWLSPRAAASLRREHEQRLTALLHRFRRLDLDPVLVGTVDAAAITARFRAWADRRRRVRRRAA
jgi:uncharacterized protein (DUF58 family)